MTGVSRGIEYPLLHEILHRVNKTCSLCSSDSICLASHGGTGNSKRQRCAWRAFGARKPTYTGLVKLESYDLTIHLEEGDSD